VFLNDFEGCGDSLFIAACGIVLFSQTQAKEKNAVRLCGLDRTSVKDATMAILAARVGGILTPPSTVDFVDSTIRIVRDTPPQRHDLRLSRT